MMTYTGYKIDILYIKQIKDNTSDGLVILIGLICLLSFLFGTSLCLIFWE